jgi:hypothetical protein
MGRLDHRQNWFTKIKLLNLVLFALIITAGAYYLVGINRLVVTGFKLQEMRQRVAALSVDNQNIENQRIALESYSNLEQKIKELKMVAIDKIDYLTPTPDVLAKK